MTNTELIVKEKGDLIDAIRNLELQKMAIEAHEKAMKEALQKAMEDRDCFELNLPGLSVRYMAPYKREGIDTARLKKEMPLIAAEFRKITDVGASIRITVKEEKHE